MSVQEKYFALSLAWSIKTDFEFVRWLIDIKRFQESAIQNTASRILYIAAVKAYAKFAPRQITPSLSDVIVEISSLTNDDIASGWNQRIRSMQPPNITDAKGIASAMAEGHDRKIVADALEGLTESVRNDKISGGIYEHFTKAVDDITKQIVGEDKTGRPSDILQMSWDAGLREPQPTGYDRLDRAIDGGWILGRLYILGMPSGHGKSSFACNFASRRAEMGLPTILNSFEMAADDALFRMICDLASVTIDVAENPRKASPQEWERIQVASALLDAHVRIYDTPADGTEIARRIRRHKVEFGGNILVEIDHLGIIRRGGRGNEWAEIERMVYDLSALAKAENVAILANSQIPTEMEKELTTNNLVFYNRDFRGSRGIRNAADYAIVGCKHSGIIAAPDGTNQHEYAYRNHTVVQVIKNRKTGGSFWGVFEYDPIYYRLLPTKVEGTADDIYA